MAKKPAKGGAFPKGVPQSPKGGVPGALMQKGAPSKPTTPKR